MEFGEPIEERGRLVSGDQGGWHKTLKTRLGRFRLDYFKGRSLPYLVTGPHALRADVSTEAEAVAAVRAHVEEIRDELSALLEAS